MSKIRIAAVFAAAMICQPANAQINTVPSKDETRINAHGTCRVVVNNGTPG